MQSDGLSNISKQTHFMNGLPIGIALKKNPGKDTSQLSTGNSLYCGHPYDRALVSLMAGVCISGILFHSDVCNNEVSIRQELNVKAKGHWVTFS